MDDFFEDEMFDSDPDCFEDQAEDDGLIDDPVTDAPVQDDQFDLVDILTIGTMIGGQAFDEIEEKSRLRLIQEQEKKDG